MDVWSLQRRPGVVVVVVVATPPESGVRSPFTGTDQTLADSIDVGSSCFRIGFPAVDRSQREEDPLAGTLLPAPRSLRLLQSSSLAASALHIAGKELHAIHQHHQNPSSIRHTAAAAKALRHSSGVVYVDDFRRSFRWWTSETADDSGRERLARIARFRGALSAAAAAAADPAAAAAVQQQRRR